MRSYKTKNTPEAVCVSAFNSSTSICHHSQRLCRSSVVQLLVLQVSTLVIASEFLSSSGKLTSRRSGLRGSSLLSVSRKCSAHRPSCSSIVVRVFPFRSLIVVEVCWDLPGDTSRNVI